MNLSELARLTSSEIVRGDADLDISSAQGLTAAGHGDITFLSDKRYLEEAQKTKASAIIVSTAIEFDRDGAAILRSANAALAYSRAQQILSPPAPISAATHPTAVIDPTANVSSNVEIHAHVVISANCQVADGVRLMPNVTLYENVSIGEGTTLHAGVSVRANAVIGRNCTLHNNVVIGSDGFGYTRDEEKRWFKVPQMGRVVIEDDVEIGAGSTVDRASSGDTRIGRGVKIDNLVQIGHSCDIDDDSLICAQTGLAGSSKLGKRVILTGQVGIAGHLTLGDDVIVTAQSATAHDVPAGTVIGGPGLENSTWIRLISIFRRLPEIVRTVRGLDKRVTALESNDTSRDK